MIIINNLKSSIKAIVFMMLLLGATVNSYSQAQAQNQPQPVQDQNMDADIDEMTPPDDEDPMNVPFDGGASILIASGVAYGVKKYKERKRKVD